MKDCHANLWRISIEISIWEILNELVTQNMLLKYFSFSVILRSWVILLFIVFGICFNKTRFRD